MTKKRRKKKSIFRSTFYRIYFALVILCIVGIVFGVRWLNGLLADYESAQPKYVADEVGRLFETSDFEAIYEVDTSAAQFAGGDKALYTQELGELTRGGEVAWEASYSPSEDERRYSVTVDGERFATFSLVPSGETTARGNRLWKLGELTTLVQLQQPEPEPEPEPSAEPEQLYLCRITVPTGYGVTVDGVALDENNAQVSHKPLFEDGFLPETVPNPTVTEYLYDATSPAPELRVTDESGAEQPVNPVPDREQTWTCPLKEDESCRQQYGDPTLALGRQVAKYIFKDAGKRSIQKICARNSPADQIFENLSNRYTTPHTGISFQNEVVSEFYSLSEDCFTCHVSFEVVLKTKNGDAVYPTAYTFCFIRQDGAGKLYNLLIY